MKAIKYTILGLGLALCAASCTDLDEKVYSSLTDKSYTYQDKDLSASVASTYVQLRDFLGHQGNFGIQEVSADAIVMPPNASGWDDGGIYRRMHYQTWNSEQVHIGNLWRTLYRGALNCNDVIDKISNDIYPGMSEGDKQSALAEVRAMRAFYYWYIMDNFGDAPLVTEPTNDLPAKSTRKEIYDFVVGELNAVIPQLSETARGEMYGRMNKWAAKCLLANVYLNAKVYVNEDHWNDCITQCDDIINSGKYSLAPNYKDNFRCEGTEDCPEIIFTIPFDQTLAGGNSIHQFSWHGELKKKFQTEATPWGCGSAMGVTQFIDTYDVDDTRLPDTWLMGQQFAADGSELYGTYDKAGQPLIFAKDIPSGNYTSEMDGYRMNKFEVQQGCNGSSNTDFPLFRYAEVLLMKAECLLRTGQPGAGALVTQVRQRDFKDHPEKAIVTDDQLKQNSSYQYGYVEDYKIVDPGNQDPIEFGRMYDELGWEFAWEEHRRRDCIRFGVYTKKSWCSHKPQGDYRTVLPIPESVLTSNPMLEQNPNYVSQ